MLAEKKDMKAGNDSNLVTPCERKGKMPLKVENHSSIMQWGGRGPGVGVGETKVFGIIKQTAMTI